MSKPPLYDNVFKILLKHYEIQIKALLSHLTSKYNLVTFSWSELKYFDINVVRLKRIKAGCQTKGLNSCIAWWNSNERILVGIDILVWHRCKCIYSWLSLSRTQFTGISDEWKISHGPKFWSIYIYVLRLIYNSKLTEFKTTRINCFISLNLFYPISNNVAIFK